jgi:hypothetical protein
VRSDLNVGDGSVRNHLNYRVRLSNLMVKTKQFSNKSKDFGIVKLL